MFNECEFPCKGSAIDQGSIKNTEPDPNPTGSTSIEVEQLTYQPHSTQTETETQTESKTEPEQLAKETTEETLEHQPANLQQYQLARDRARRELRPPARYFYAELIFSAFACRYRDPEDRTRNI